MAVASAVKKYWQSPYVVIFLCIISYCPNLFIPSENGWIYDDMPAILRNRCVSGIDIEGNPVKWYCFLVSDYWGTNIKLRGSHKSYRPITTLTFMFDYSLWKTTLALPYHWTNVFFHTVTSVLVYHVAIICFKTSDGDPAFAASISSLLFAVHPVHSEAVSNIVGRADVLGGLFMCLGFILFDRYRHVTWLQITCGVIFGILAALSKETGFVVLGLYVVLLICWEIDRLKSAGCWNSLSECVQNVSRSTITRCVIVVLATGLLFYMRCVHQVEKPGFPPTMNPAGHEPRPFPRRMTLLYYLFMHVSLLVFPFVLCPDYSDNAIPLIESISTDQRSFFLLLFYVALAVIACKVICMTLDARTHASPLILAMCWLVFPLVPASNLFFIVGFTVAERILYTASIGYCLLVAYIIERLKTVFDKCADTSRHSEKIRNAFLICVVLFSIRCGIRDYEWNASDKLWYSATKVCPNSAIALGNHIFSLVETNKLEEALMLSEKLTALKLPVKDVNQRANLVALYKRMGKDAKALELAHDIAKTGYPGIFPTLVTLEAERENWKEVDRYCSKMFSLPTEELFFFVDHTQLSVIRYYHLKSTISQTKLNEIIPTFMTYLNVTRDPSIVAWLHLLMSDHYKRQNNTLLAIQHARNAGNVKPDTSDAIESVATQLRELECFNDAEEVLRSGLTGGQSNDTTLTLNLNMVEAHKLLVTSSNEMHDITTPHLRSIFSLHYLAWNVISSLATNSVKKALKYLLRMRPVISRMMKYLGPYGRKKLHILHILHANLSAYPIGVVNAFQNVQITAFIFKEFRTAPFIAALDHDLYVFNTFIRRKYAVGSITRITLKLCAKDSCPATSYIDLLVAYIRV